MLKVSFRRFATFYNAETIYRCIMWCVGKYEGTNFTEGGVIPICARESGRNISRATESGAVNTSTAA